MVLKTWSLRSLQGLVWMFHVKVWSWGLYPSPVLVMKSIPNIAGSVRLQMMKKFCPWYVPWMHRGSCIFPRICSVLYPAVAIPWLLSMVSGVVRLSCLKTFRQYS